jgi:hypothetical protein
VTDLCGSRLPDGAPMRAHAERVALALMERVVERFDWSGWQVEVYDAKGRRVWIRAFPDVNVDTRPVSPKVRACRRASGSIRCGARVRG